MACLVAGCGGGTSRRAAPLPLSAYLVQGGEQTGYRALTDAVQVKTAKSLTGGDPAAAADIRRLNQEGFRSAMVRETVSGHGQGLSRVIQLRSGAAATTEARAQLASLQGPGVAGFSVPGVPNARGASGAQDTYANVVFTEGRCVMLVGGTASPGRASAPVIAAVRAIDARTHGRPGACSP